jgi:hypothetical protein
MGEWVDIPLVAQIGQEAQGALTAGHVSDQELVNLMLVQAPPGTRRPFFISHTPGTTADAALPGSGTVRGICMRNDRLLFMVRDTSVYYKNFVTGTWTQVPVGSMPGTDVCRMVDADTHIVCVDGTNARAITTAASTACSRGNFSDVTFQDGITLFTETGTNSVYASNVDDPTTIGALNYTTADALGGDCVGIISDHREVFVFKTNSVEYFYNSGSSGFPFTRGSPGLIERGCWLYGKWTIQKLDKSVFWVGEDMRVYRMNGYQPEPISTPWVERYMVNALTQVLDGSAEFYGSAFYFNGIPYYAISGFADLNNEGGLTTLYCNLLNNTWHRRTDIQPIGAANIGSSQPVLATSSNLYSLSPTGSSLSRRMTLPQVYFGGQRATMHELMFDMAPSTSGTMTVSWEDTGDSAYSAGVSCDMTQKTPRVLRMGSFVQRSIRAEFASNSSVAVMGVRARVDVGEA